MFISKVEDFLNKSGQTEELSSQVSPGKFTRPVGGLLKRGFDIFFSVAALLTMSGFMLCIAVFIFIASKGPIFFVQRRIGYDGEDFPCLKFRTMVVDAEDRLQDLLEENPEAATEFNKARKLKDDPRIIPGIGNFLRKTSLDELPQFFNVILGHMSVVGPRPVTVDEWRDFYGEGHSYESARPGITGLWQTSGRNSLSFDERCRMDTTYVRTWSFFGDLQIIARTVRVVCVSQNGY